MSNTHFSLDPKTDVFLTDVFNEINEKYFSGSIVASIFWQVPPTNNFEPCPPGSVELNAKRIMVHPYLMKAFTPRFAVEYIIFHECLHLHLGFQEDREPHCKTFMVEESKFQNRDKAKTWLKKNSFPILNS